MSYISRSHVTGEKVEVKRREGHVRWVDCLFQALASVWSSWKEKVTSNPHCSTWPSAHLMINNTKFAKTCLRKILGLAQNICWIVAVLGFLSVQFGSCCQFAEESYLCHRSVSYPGGKMIAYPYESSHLARWYLIRGPAHSALSHQRCPDHLFQVSSGSWWTWVSTCSAGFHGDPSAAQCLEKAEVRCSRGASRCRTH